MMKDEEVIWESFQGKNYRIFNLVKDTLIVIIFSIAIYYLSDLAFEEYKGKIMTVAILIGIAYIAIQQAKLMLVKYVITNDRVIIKRGWLNVKLTSITLTNVLDTKAEQNIKERLIRTGTVYLFTANDSQNSDDSFIQNVPKIANVDDPFGRHAMIAEIIKDAKRG